jgi:hypothetical protein
MTEPLLVAESKSAELQRLPALTHRQGLIAEPTPLDGGKRRR